MILTSHRPLVYSSTCVSTSHVRFNTPTSVPTVRQPRPHPDLSSDDEYPRRTDLLRWNNPVETFTGCTYQTEEIRKTVCHRTWGRVILQTGESLPFVFDLRIATMTFISGLFFSVKKNYSGILSTRRIRLVVYWNYLFLERRRGGWESKPSKLTFPLWEKKKKGNWS